MQPHDPSWAGVHIWSGSGQVPAHAGAEVPSHSSMSFGSQKHTLSIAPQIWSGSGHEPLHAGAADASHGVEHTHPPPEGRHGRSEEHTSELQSQSNLVCRL